MLVSAAIHDWDMAADKYFALNGTVPAEAYDSSMVDARTNKANRLLHPDWHGYEVRTWSANYHQLFTNAGKARIGGVGMVQVLFITFITSAAPLWLLIAASV